MQSKPLTPKLSVGPQISAADMAEAARWFGAIINNRPDDEEPDQPSSAELEAEAKRLGLAYRHIPIIPGQLDEQGVQAFGEAVDQLGGPIFAFCRTGARAASLWALSQADQDDTDRILTTAKQAGYDLTSLRPRLDAAATTSSGT